MNTYLLFVSLHAPSREPDLVRALVCLYGAFVEGGTTDVMLPKRASQKRQLDKFGSSLLTLCFTDNAVVGAVRVLLLLIF